MTAMRNPDAKHIDFKALEGLIPDNPKFLPSNIDMICERNGCFLIGEWKRPTEEISNGQRGLLKMLARQPRTVVLIIVGDTDNGINVEEVWWMPPQGERLLLGSGFEVLVDIYLEWYNGANKVKR